MRLKTLCIIVIVGLTYNCFGQSERTYSLLNPPSMKYTKAEGKTNANKNKTGQWRFWRKDGSLISIVSYEDGKINGNQKIYWNNGTLYRTSNYIKGLKNGTEKIYLKNGYTYEINSFQNDLKNGESKEFDGKGNVQFIKNYKNDVLHGIYQEFYDGELEEYGNYLQGKKDGKWITFEDGKIEVEAEYKNGLAHGLWKQRYSNPEEFEIDKVESEYQMTNGILINPMKVHEYTDEYSENTSTAPDDEYYEVKHYYWTGNVKESTFNPQYPSGFLKLGKWNMKDMEGNLIITIVYDIEGVEETKTIYFRNGSIKEKWLYDKGKPIGCKTYFENGNVKSIKNYKEGYNRDGEYFEYFENGNPKIIGNHKVFYQAEGYFKSYHMGFWKFFYKNGKIKEQGNYVKNSNNSLEGLKDGAWKYYNEEGKLIKTENYSNGIKQ